MLMIKANAEIKTYSDKVDNISCFFSKPSLEVTK